MDFSGVTIETADNVTAATNALLRMKIAPDVKEAQISRLLEVVGTGYRNQMYGAASEVFDSTAIVSSAGIDDKSQARRLANKIVRNYALNRDTTDSLITEFFNALLGNAQNEAFTNAVSMQKHPTLKRTLGPKKDCAWCIAKAGTYTNPTGEDFRRHGECDCRFEVSGYNSRNGVLKNYTKGKVNSR